MTKSKTDFQNYKPSDYLRARRPESYSDSIIVEKPQLTRCMFEYHLDTLTNRGQERGFEHFARCLAEKELCPNLIPQTGPTGGGDSKVDTETYPVSEEISLRWYQGDASATERWAFAISAKADWKSKIKSDVKKIAKTKRNYSLIYFITNQFVKDRDRTDVEKKLKDEFGINVRILDRGWIVDRVFTNDRLEIAAQTLSIEGMNLKPTRALGPLDAQRETELTALDININDPSRYTGIVYQLAEDIHRAAILASELERDQLEVNGRFQAAIRVAEKVRDKAQILRIIYSQAWKMCFVYDDIAMLSNLYDKVELLGLSSDYSGDVQKVHNLWNVLFGAVKLNQLSEEDSKLIPRGKALEKRLEELAEDEAHPNNSLSARTALCIYRIALLNFKNAELSKFNEHFRELKNIFDSSRGFGQYPFDAYKQIIFELGDVFTDSDVYEELYDLLVSLVEERLSEGEAGIAITNRGIQKLKADKIYEAIKHFGNAQEKLAKDEYRYALIKCLIATGSAYKSAGLYWAAKSNLMAALSICVTELNFSGFMHPLALLAAKENVWIEMKLGRVPHVLFGLSLTNVVANHLQLDDERDEMYWDFIQHIDTALSMLLLRSKLWQLKELRKIPHLLEQLNLICAEHTLLFALGEIEVLKDSEWCGENESIEKIEKFFELLNKQSANHDLPLTPTLFLDDITELKSEILGLNFVAYVDTNPTSVLIAESFLSALEAFLATSLEGGIVPYRQNAKVSIKTDEQLVDYSELKLIKNSPDFDIEVLHAKTFSPSSVTEISKFKNIIIDFISDLLPKITVSYGKGNDHIKKLIEEENVFGRSLLFSDAITLSQNVSGDMDWLDLSKISRSINKTAYQVKRSTQWTPKKGEVVQKPLNKGEGEVPEDIANTENLKHTERKVMSLIDIPTWDQADWKGTYFMVFLDGGIPPCMGLIFENEEASREIFKGWINQFGNRDKKEELRICFIKDIDKSNPSHYRVHIGTNIDAYPRIDDQRQIVMTSRINTMTPDNDRNLNRFLRAYNEVNEYCIFPAVFQSASTEPKIIRDLVIYKKLLVIKPAWQIAINDFDFVVLKHTDNPKIPENVNNAPVIKAIKKKRERFEKN